MTKLLAGILVGALGVYAYQRSHRPPPDVSMYEQEQEQPQPPRALPAVEIDNSGFHCDGRTRCPQMKSCAEAKYFLEHCPGTRMDGDNDGIPCEGQHCPN